MQAILPNELLRDPNFVVLGCPRLCSQQLARVVP